MMCKKLYDIQNMVNDLEKDTEGLQLVCELLEEYLGGIESRKASLIVRTIGKNLEEMKKKEERLFNVIDEHILEEKKNLTQ